MINSVIKRLLSYSIEDVLADEKHTKALCTDIYTYYESLRTIKRPLNTITESIPIAHKLVSLIKRAKGKLFINAIATIAVLALEEIVVKDLFEQQELFPWMIQEIKTYKKDITEAENERISILIFVLYSTLINKFIPLKDYVLSDYELVQQLMEEVKVVDGTAIAPVDFFSVLIKYSNNTIRTSLLSMGLLEKMKGKEYLYFLRVLSYFPDELYNHIELDKVKKLCLMQISTANTNDRINALIILCNLNAYGNILNDLKLNNVILDEVSRLTLMLIESELDNERYFKDFPAIQINEKTKKTEACTFYKYKNISVYESIWHQDLSFILAPLNALVSIESPRNQFFSKTLIEKLLAISESTILDEMQHNLVVRILHQFTKTNIDEQSLIEAYGSEGTLTTYKNLNNKYNGHLFFSQTKIKPLSSFSEYVDLTNTEVNTNDFNQTAL
jgi:hypothetical protein